MRILSTVIAYLIVLCVWLNRGWSVLERGKRARKMLFLMLLVAVARAQDDPCATFNKDGTKDFV